MANRENLRERDRTLSPGREQRGEMQNPNRQEELRKGSERVKGGYGRKSGNDRSYEQNK